MSSSNSASAASTGTGTGASDADTHAPSYESRERRYEAAGVLSSWELLAMHSIAADESIARVRLRMMKRLAGLPEEEPALPTPGRRRGMRE